MNESKQLIATMTSLRAQEEIYYYEHAFFHPHSFMIQSNQPGVVPLFGSISTHTHTQPLISSQKVNSQSEKVAFDRKRWKKPRICHAQKSLSPPQKRNASKTAGRTARKLTKKNVTLAPHTHTVVAPHSLPA